MKKVILFILLFWTLVIYFSCTKGNAQPNADKVLITNPTTINGKNIGAENSPATIANLHTANNINTGNVTVTNDAYYIYVSYRAQKGYVLTQTHLYIGASYLLPVTKTGSIIIDKFPYSSIHKNLVSYTYQIPILAIPAGNCGSIAAQADVAKYNAEGKIIDQQTVWGNGVAVNNKNNAEMQFDYCSISK